MEDYIGKICPFCRNEIQEGDNVITEASRMRYVMPPRRGSH